MNSGQTLSLSKAGRQVVTQEYYGFYRPASLTVNAFRCANCGDFFRLLD